MKHSIFWRIIVVFAFSISTIAHAQNSGGGSSAQQKSEEKKSVRWTLEGWLKQKEQMRMSDLWLARNSHSSPFELFVDFRSVGNKKTDGSENAVATNENLLSSTVAAYAGVAGIRGSYDRDSEKRSVWAGSFNLRLMGRALQDTHINLEYGLRGSDFGGGDAGKFSNQFGGVTTNFYLTKYFGVEGAYYKILSGESDTQRKLKGEESRAGIFIDFAMVRVFGYWRNELLNFNEGGVADAREKRTGYGGGLRFYF